MSKKYFFFGACLPPEDGHKRITSFENGVTMGGTEEEHEKMVDAGMEIDEVINKKAHKGPEYLKEAIREILEDR